MLFTLYFRYIYLCIQLHLYNYAETLRFSSSHERTVLLSGHVEGWHTSAPLFIQSTCVTTGPITKALAGPAARLHATLAQVILLWVGEKGAVVVTTTRKAEGLQQSVGDSDLGTEQARDKTWGHTWNSLGLLIFPGKRFVQRAISAIELQLPLAGGELWSAGVSVSVWDAIESLAM